MGNGDTKYQGPNSNNNLLFVIYISESNKTSKFSEWPNKNGNTSSNLILCLFPTKHLKVIVNSEIFVKLDDTV